MTDALKLKGWTILGDTVQLVYRDDTKVVVWKKDFDRAFGTIISADKPDIIRDFAIN